MEDYLIRTYIKRNLADLLAKTTKMFPDIFTPEIIANEMSLLTRQVADMDITYNLLTRQPAVQQPSIVAEPVTSNLPIIPAFTVVLPPTQIESIPSVSRPRNVLLPVPSKPRCIARVMDKENPITQDSQGNKIYGKQCSRPENDPATHKCTMHTKHSPHGDFTTVPSDVLMQHFQHVQSKVAKKAS
jgi:hypothetical protein